MVEEKILTLNPDPKKSGTNISKAKYDVVKTAILNILEKQGSMTFQNLSEAVNQELVGKFEGSITWYFTTVKLDLEAREIIERVGKSSPQMIRLSAKNS